MEESQGWFENVLDFFFIAFVTLFVLDIMMAKK